jgi:CysZ protein
MRLLFMIFDAAATAFQEMFTPPFRRVLVKTLALTILLLVLAFVGLSNLLGLWLVLLPGWLATGLTILSGLGLAIGLAFAIPPVSFLVAGLYFDELAEVVEHDLGPDVPIGVAPPYPAVIWLVVKFVAAAVVVNLVALLLLLVPGVNAIAFFGANAYLLGRGYFEFAALRYHRLAEVRELRRRHTLDIILAGLFIAALAAVPVVNLLTPLFATALMVRVHNGLTRHTLPNLADRQANR